MIYEFSIRDLQRAYGDRRIPYSSEQQQYWSFLLRLRARLATPLPGVAAQRVMAPMHRLDEGYDPFPNGARKAAVLLVLWPAIRRVAGEPSAETEGRDRNSHAAITIPLIERPRDGSTHSGQIAFPGGHWEDREAYPVETAMREAREELGLDTQLVEVLGALTPLYIPVSGTVVTPVVAAVESEPRLTPSAEEVSSVHFSDLARLERSRELGCFETPAGAIVAPTFRLDGAEVWGATAMILNELLWLHQDLVGSDDAGRSRR